MKMKTGSVKTPELALASNALADLLTSANKGVADEKQGRMVIGGSNGMCRVIKTDLDRRLAVRKLEKVEGPVARAK